MKQLSAPMIFVSGDRHYSEVMAIEEELLGYETREITSSGTHSYSWNHRFFSSLRRLDATSKYNFAIVDTLAAGSSVEGQVSFYSKSGRELFSQPIFVKKR